MDLKTIKERYENVQTFNPYGNHEMVAVLKEDLDYLIKKAERVDTYFRQLQQAKQTFSYNYCRKLTDENKKMKEIITDRTKDIIHQHKEIEKFDKLKNTTILQIAQQLEDGLIHSGTLDEEMSVLEFIKHYL